jgi:hypothetical protein
MGVNAIVHAFLCTTDLHYVTLETKSIVAR